MTVSIELPVAAIREPLLAALARGPVVVSSPTGSGKSTEVPRWCPGRVLVIEPRRIACQSLAARVAELEQTPLGQGVGYAVRDDSRYGATTRIVFATPGIALRNAALLESAGTIVLDEFHERGIESDLLLGLLLKRRRTAPDRAPKLIVMSATLDGERVASHLQGQYLVAEGRTFPVVVHHQPTRSLLPESAELAERVLVALERSQDDPGDVLVFLPGKPEIDACFRLLQSKNRYSLVPLHGGLTLEEQRAAFVATSRRKVILATNVAETSITIPGVGVVIDSGLVKQTRYRDGRASLMLAPIALDSAAQRSGRAGRTCAGVSYRLWSSAAALAKLTLPEIYRESLVPLVLSAAVWGEKPEQLPLLDPAKDYALADARAELSLWGALAADGSVNERGLALHALPIDAAHARLLIEAKRLGCLEDALDLVAGLAAGRPLFRSGADAPAEDLRRSGCDATALVRAVRCDRPEEHGLSRGAWEEARRTRARLRREFGLDARDPRHELDRDALLSAAIAADPRVVHIARSRGQELAFSNGGTELGLSRESALRRLRELEAIVVLETRAFGAGKDTRLLVTCAAAVPFSVVVKAGLGQDQLGAVRLEGGKVLAKVERVYAQRVIATRDEVPQGAVARAALAELFLRGSLFKAQQTLTLARERVAQHALAAKLATRNHPAFAAAAGFTALSLEAWVLARLLELGVESGEDLALLSAKDLLPPELPYELASLLDRDFPMTVDLGDCRYQADYDLDANTVILRVTKGGRKEPPPLAYLPKFPGLRICVDGPRGLTVLRERR